MVEFKPQFVRGSSPSCGHGMSAQLLDCSSPGFSVPGIFQARILGWAVISYSKWSSQPRNQTHAFSVSCIGRQSLYHCTTWEAPLATGPGPNWKLLHLHPSTVRPGWYKDLAWTEINCESKYLSHSGEIHDNGLLLSTESKGSFICFAIAALFC